ncbi:hypothetical protein [Halomarina pelagica]|nr:hypothetical protein [Halomarina sp. BND7]
MLSALGRLIDTFGPFLVPVAVFVAGLIGYGLLFLLTRYAQRL